MWQTPEKFEKVTKTIHGTFCFGLPFGSPKSTKIDKNAVQKIIKKMGPQKSELGGHFFDFCDFLY